MFEPQNVLISRSGDASHERLQQVPGIIVTIPSVGQSLQMFLDSGETMWTSPVTHVEHDDVEIVVDTRNSRYHLELRS